MKLITLLGMTHFSPTFFNNIRTVVRPIFATISKVLNKTISFFEFPLLVTLSTFSWAKKQVISEAWGLSGLNSIFVSGLFGFVDPNKAFPKYDLPAPVTPINTIDHASFSVHVFVDPESFLVLTFFAIFCIS